MVTAVFQLYTIDELDPELRLEVLHNYRSLAVDTEKIAKLVNEFEKYLAEKGYEVTVTAEFENEFVKKMGVKGKLLYSNWEKEFIKSQSAKLHPYEPLQDTEIELDFSLPREEGLQVELEYEMPEEEAVDTRFVVAQVIGMLEDELEEFSETLESEVSAMIQEDNVHLVLKEDLFFENGALATELIQDHEDVEDTE